MDFNKIVQDVLNRSKELGNTLFKQYSEQAGADAREFFEASRVSLERAANLVAAGKIDPEDFEDLVRGKRDLAKMIALKQAGLAKAAIDTFTNGILNIFIDAVFTAIP